MLVETQSKTKAVGKSKFQPELEHVDEIAIKPSAETYKHILTWDNPIATAARIAMNRYEEKLLQISAEALVTKASGDQKKKKEQCHQNGTCDKLPVTQFLHKLHTILLCVGTLILN